MQIQSAQTEAFQNERFHLLSEGPENALEARSPKSGSAAFPVLPERYRPIREIVQGTEVTGISREFIQNLTFDPFDSQGLKFPNLRDDPEMLSFMQEQNKLTASRIDSNLLASFQKSVDEKSAAYMPPEWRKLSSDGLKTISSSTSLTGAADLTEAGRRFIITQEGANNGKLIAVDESDPSKVQTIIPESKDFEMAQVFKLNAGATDKYVVSGRRDGVSVLQIYDQSGQVEKQIPMPGFGIIHDAKAGSTPSEINLLFDTPTSAPRILHLDTATNEVNWSPQRNDAFDSGNYVTEKVVVPWQDIDGKAQEMPVYVSHNKTMKLDGNNNALAEVYGGFDVAPYWPQFYPETANWLEQGGVTIAPVLPGDGGRGLANYELGIGARKQNTYLATIAMVEQLQKMGFTSPARTGIYGVSNGGTGVNTVLNMRPDLFGAASSESAVNSVIDSPTINVRAGKDWTAEFGDPAKPEDFKRMSKIDVLNNISASQKYPPMLIGVGAKDGIVNAGNGITYASLRQSMDNGETLLRVRLSEGHEPEDLVAQTAFLWSRLSK